VSYLHISLHVLSTMPIALLSAQSLPFLPSSPMSCHATPSIIERSGEASDGVVETISCPSSAILLQRRPSASLPPVLLLFLFISSSLPATVSPSLSSVLSPSPSLTVLFLSCLVFPPSHFMDDEETRGIERIGADRKGCVEQEEQ
jgi:hypothetical protein